MEERIKPWQDLGVLAIENEIAAMYTIASLVGSRAGAVLVVVDNYATGETIDFDNEYDDLIAKAIDMATLAMAKIQK